MKAYQLSMIRVRKRERHDSCCAEGGKPKLVLPLHRPEAGSDYFLGMFLGGVYQEVMGSAHNMLGSTHVVQVKVAPERSHRQGELILLLE